MALPSVPRELSNQKGTFGVQRHRPPRLTPGAPVGVMVFASSPIRQPLKYSTYRMVDPARRVRLYKELE